MLVDDHDCCDCPRKATTDEGPDMTSFTYAVTVPASVSAGSLCPDRPLAVSMRPSEFAAELLWATARVAVIALRGEIDAYTAPRFREAAERALQRGAKSLVVDLGEVEFIDATGLGVAAQAARRLSAGAVAVVTARRSVVHILRLVGLDYVLEVCETREQALRALPAD